MWTELPAPAGIRTPIVQPVVSRYTDSYLTEST
jgi:hypothetical protein